MEQEAIDSGDVDSRRLPIIALTAMSLTEDRDRAMSVGFDGFLSKPFSQDDMLEMLLSWRKVE